MAALLLMVSRGRATRSGEAQRLIEEVGKRPRASIPILSSLL
jgi:hypothetical protein